MIELIITLINARLAAWGRLVTNHGLCELREDGDGKTWPRAYVGSDELAEIEIDSGSLTYLRLTGAGPNDERVSIPYVAGDQRQITYPLRLVAIAHRSDFTSPLALADELGNVLNGLSDDIDQLQTGITSNVTVNNKEARTPSVFIEEFQGIDDHDLQYNRCMVAVDFSVQVTGLDECWPDPCQTDIDIITLFNFCDKAVRDRLTPEQIECLTDALCETPPTLCEQLGDVAPEDVVADVFDCLTPEAQDELISEVCPPCDPLTITFNGETITTIDEPCGETVALTCSTLTASAYVEDGNPVTGAYHPDGTLNGKTKYTKDVTHYLFYNGTEWELEKQGANETATAGNENFPWLATWPTITVTQANIGEACCECASGEVVVTNSEGDPIATIDVPSGVTVPYEIPDVDWTDSDGSAQSTPYGDAIVCTPCTAPSLAVSTSNATPAYGSSVTLTATATGFTPTIYTWYANGVEIGTGSSLAWTVNRPGSISIICVATDGTLTAQNSVSLTVSLALNSVWYGDGVNDGFAVTYRPLADTDKFTVRFRFLSEATGSSWPVSIINNASGGELIRININTTQIITYVWTGTGFLAGTANYNVGVYNELLVTRCTGNLVGANNITRIYLNGVLVNSAINTNVQAVGITGYFGQTIYGNTKMKVKCLSFFSGLADNTSAAQLLAQSDTDLPSATGLTLEEHFVFSDAPFVPNTTGKLSRVEGIMGNGNIWFNQGHASPYGLVAP